MNKEGQRMDSHDSEPEVITLTPSTGNALGSQKTPPPNLVWGKLNSTTTYLKSVELDKPSFSLGRAGGCDVTVSRENFPPNCLPTVSKVHFTIHYDETTAMAKITDLSKNGTYINKQIAGQSKTVILQNDDEIAIGTKQQRVYIYHSIEKEKSPYLPSQWNNKYVTSRTLGAGACGEVKLCYEKDTGKEYAVKKIVKAKVDFTPNLNTPERIQNEILILKSLSHPCIISMKDFIQTDEAVFIILNYMKGGDLLDRMESSINALPECEIKLIFYQLVIGVQYLHSRGITHRDLKPGNVLLKSEDSETVVKISDFGLSKIIQNNSLMSTACGTLGYMAPEILNTQCRKYTQAVDIWSLGVILFHMLSKQLPFKANDQYHLARLILSGKYKMDEDTWKSISKNAKDVVKQMLVMDPSKRIQINDILNHPWIAEDQDMQAKARILMNKDGNCEDYNSSNVVL